MFGIGKRLMSALAALFLLALCTCVVSGCRENTQAPDDTGELPVLRIGIDEYPPYSYIDGDGSFAGIDMELATEACRRMGLRAEFVMIDWSEKNEWLESGKVNCLWSSFSMNGREDRYRWAGPYMTSRQVVAVRADSDIYRLADLADKRVAVQATTKPDELFSDRDNPQIPQVKQLYCLFDMENVFAALRKGYVDAIAGHETALLEKMQSVEGEYRILEESLLDVNMGVAFRPDDDRRLVEQLTTTLAQMRKDGFTDRVLAAYGLNPEKEG